MFSLWMWEKRWGCRPIKEMRKPPLQRCFGKQLIPRRGAGSGEGEEVPGEALRGALGGGPGEFPRRLFPGRGAEGRGRRGGHQVAAWSQFGPGHVIVSWGQ